MSLSSPRAGGIDTTLADRVSPGLGAPRALVGGAEHAPHVPLAPTSVASAPPGQAFLDLLLLGALSCQTPVSLLSVPQADGTWSTLSHGFEVKEGLNDPQLFATFASHDDPYEIEDLMTAVPGSPLVQPPHSMRWAYGVALRSETGALLGVVVVLDLWVRKITKREHRAMASLARQVSAQLAGIRRPAAPAFPRPDLPTPIARVGAVTPRANGPDKHASEPHQLLRSHEVAVMFDVTERTVINWAASGKLPSLRTIGGHLRFRRDDVMRLLSGASEPQAPAAASGLPG
jgi:excisionase family DNA binding protein